MNPARGTIRDMARDTGLSVATISRVMNGAENVSITTREKVLEASARLNYIPNPAARTLVTKRSHTIAAIVPTLEHSIFATFLTAVENALAELGYSLVVAVTDFDPEEEIRVTRKLLGMGAEGFIYSGVDHSDDLYQMLARRGAPFVFTSFWDKTASAPTIGYDNRDLATKAVAHLYELGHRNIGVLHGPIFNNDRMQARVAGVTEFSKPDLNLTLFETSISARGGTEMTKQVLDKAGEVTALLCLSDVIALGALFALGEAGWMVPGDISLMGFDNLDWSPWSTPPLTTIDLPTTEMGTLASKGLVKMLEDGENISSVKLEGRIVVRGSTGTVPVRARNASTASDS